VPLCVSGAGEACDANGDGRDDVRDLVIMTRCFTHVLPPDDSLRICRDCDGDSLFVLDDLFCCASHILRLPLVPRDSVQANDAVEVIFDRSEQVGDVQVVRVRVKGAQSLGAALVRLSYPAGRWRVSLPTVLPGRVDGPWIPIEDVGQPGLAHLGAV